MPLCLVQLAGHLVLTHCELCQADLIREAWWEKLPPRVDAIVSTWALHDLGDPEHIARVYRDSRPLLEGGGMLLNGDFIKPAGTRFDYEAGRFGIDQHLRMFQEAGFTHSECLLILETELEKPTAAQNYALLKAT